MRVTLEIRGGLAAAVMRRPLSVDLDELSAVDRAASAALIAEVSGAETPASAIPDAVSYRITVSDDHGDRVLRASDATASHAFRDLVRWVQEHGR